MSAGRGRRGRRGAAGSCRPFALQGRGGGRLPGGRLGRGLRAAGRRAPDGEGGRSGAGGGRRPRGAARAPRGFSFTRGVGINGPPGDSWRDAGKHRLTPALGCLLRKKLPLPRGAELPPPFKVRARFPCAFLSALRCPGGFGFLAGIEGFCRTRPVTAGDAGQLVSGGARGEKGNYGMRFLPLRKDGSKSSK